MATKFHKISKKQWMLDAPQEVDNYLWGNLYEEIQLPERKTRWSSGYDFHAPYTITLEPGEEELIPTGIKIELNPDQELLIFPRSSLGFKYYIRLANSIGKIDADYFNNVSNEGHIFVKIRNEGRKSVVIDKGDSFCQGTIYQFNICDNDSFDDGNIREGGIGSTDK
jgi:dUTP pyrophosphatase